MTSPGVHRIRANHREWTPPQVITLDTETRPEDTPAGELHTLRCWAARLDVRRARSQDGTGTVRSSGRTVAGLADQLELWCAGQRTVWMYAHNLSFDLAVTRLPAELHSRGWEVTAHAVSSDAPWLRMKRGACILTICDSWGWLRTDLATVGRDLGHEKPDLPAWDAGDAPWLARCEADCDILAAAMLALMDWWDGQQLGSWTLTGAAGGWNTWRHRTPGELPLVVPDAGQTAADREAIYGGRREAFRHGRQAEGPWVLADFRSAYPSVAAAYPLPCARQGSFESMPLQSPVICGDSYGIIARCVVDTPGPRYPVRAGGRIAYPVGRFSTVLAGPELADARDRGLLVSIGRGYLHRLSPHMRDWARWILAESDETTSSCPPVVRRAVKHWGRATIGKTAARGWRTIPLASLGGTGWDYRPAWNAAQNAPSHLVDVCGQAAEVISCGDGDNAYPAILAWVESWVRVWLGRALDRISSDSVACCDTDGMVVLESAWPGAGGEDVTFGPLRMRRKATYGDVNILGPQHVITDQDRKLAGIPRSARENEHGDLVALLWPKLSAQMNARPGGTEPGYLRTRQTYTLAASYVTGHVHANGRVFPLTAGICQAGETHLLPLPGTSRDQFPESLQATHLREMLTPINRRDTECTSHTPRSNGTAGGSNPSSPTPSSPSSPRTTRRKAGRPGKWRTTGALFARRARLAFSGRTPT